MQKPYFSLLSPIGFINKNITFIYNNKYKYK